MTYRVAITRAYAHPDGSTIFGDIGLDRLTQAGIAWSVLPEAHARIDAAELEGCDAAIVLGPEVVDADSIPANGRLRHIARFGAGYDAVDVEACTNAGVLVTNTPDAVRQPMAHTAVALLLAVAHRVLEKDRLVRDGRWSERGGRRGRGLIGATVGIVGFGGIGQAVAHALSGLGVRIVASNRSDRTDAARDLGVRMLPLAALLRESDYVILTVPGGAATSRLIGGRELDLLGPDGALINIARGSVVDEEALIERLRDGRLSGAGLDVFEQEPVSETNPLLDMQNVVLAPHSLCWTDGFTAQVSAGVVDAVLAVHAGRTPSSAVNPDAVRSEGSAPVRRER